MKGTGDSRILRSRPLAEVALAFSSSFFQRDWVSLGPSLIVCSCHVVLAFVVFDREKYLNDALAVKIDMHALLPKPNACKYARRTHFEPD